MPDAPTEVGFLFRFCWYTSYPNQAKLTDFGLHKRARYSRTEDVLIAVTSEWSTHGGKAFQYGGSVYGGNAYGSNRSVHGSAHGKDASFYGGNAYGGGSYHRATAAAAGGSVHQQNPSTSAHYTALASAGLAAAAAGGGVSGGGGGEVGAVRAGSCSGRGPTSPEVSDHGVAGGAGGSLHGVAGGSLHGAAGGAGGSVHGAAGGAGGNVHGVAGGVGGSLHGASSNLPPGPGASAKNSLHAGSEAASALGLPGYDKPYLLAYDKGRYAASLPASSKVSSVSDLVAAHDAAVAHAAAAATGAAHASAITPGGVSPGATLVPSSKPSASPFAAVAGALQDGGAAAVGGGQAAGGSGSGRKGLNRGFLSHRDGSSHRNGSAHGAMGQLTQLASTSPSPWGGGDGTASAVPPAIAEETAQRKMLALMAFESAAAAAAGQPQRSTAHEVGGSVRAGRAYSGTAAGLRRAKSSGLDAVPDGEEAAQQPFSVTEFVKAAVALQSNGSVPPECDRASAGGAPPDGAPSALTLMRSMTLALQQQKETREQQQQQQQSQQQQQQNQQQQGLQQQGSGGPDGAPASPLSLMQPPSTAHRFPRATAAAAMKTVPEDTRMSLDLGARPMPPADTRSPNGRGSGSGGGARGNRPPPSSLRGGVSRRERLASAAAKMADATRQVGGWEAALAFVTVCRTLCVSQA